MSHWDRVVWQDVRGKEGAAQGDQIQMPVNFLCVPPRAPPRQAAEALRQAERVCCCSPNLQTLTRCASPRC